MNNNILLDRPKIRFETHLKKPQNFPFIIRQHKDHRRSTFGIHENLELLYILDGEGVVLYNDIRHSVHKGDMVVVNSYAVHQVQSQGELPVFCLIIDREFCQYNGIDPTKLHFQSIIRNDPQASMLFGAIIDAYARKDDQFHNAAFKCTVLDMLIFLCRHYSESGSECPQTTPSFNHIRSAIGYMKANFAQKITMEDIAASTGLSKFHFIREFKRFTGQTPNHYLNAIRCEHARNLLESGLYSVKEVAFLCGFTNNSYFSSVFQKYIHMLPSQIHPT